MIGRFAIVVLLLGALVMLAFAFRLENKAWLQVLALAAAGFPLHHVLPARLRLLFFAALSLLGLVVVLGPGPAAWILALGSALIGLAHLPLAFFVRLALAIAAGAALALLRASWLPAPWPAAIWPVLGSMFMFRYPAYLYDLRTRGAPCGPARACSYFFMLPNVCFPLFPVIDYKTFCLTYHNDERFRIYQTGLDWMLRGFLQLLAHRFIYQNLLIDPEELSGLGGFAAYATSTYLLYLYVSGSFHLIVGTLHLYGFNLPETHHRYLLASSFTDFWQRINVYWKEFMTKLVFFPAYFRLKRRIGPRRALLVATATVFGASWLLHSYQWFWLRGSFPLRGPDALFWGAMALPVAVAAWRTRRPAAVGGPRRGVVTAFRAARTFAIVVVLWSLWTADSLAEWTALVARAGRVTPLALGVVLVVLAGIGCAAVFFGRSSVERTEGGAAASARTPFPFWRHAAIGLVVGGLLLLLGGRPRLLQFEPRLVDVVDQLRTPRLNTRDTRLLERGYYEELTDVTRLSPELWQLYTERSIWPLIDELPGVRHVDDLLEIELPASTTLDFKGAPMHVNRWGFRDREYEEHPSPGTRRFVLVGASISLGGGVTDDETWENRAEDRLNRESEDGTRFEILNLSIGAYGPLQKLRMLERYGFGFAPQALLYEGNPKELELVVSGLNRALLERREIPWDFPREAAREAGVDGTTGRTRAALRLRPRAEQLLTWVYARIVGECRERGIDPYYVYVPRVREAFDARADRSGRILELARQAGFEVLDLSRAYSDRDESLALVPWDWHPNAEGHRLLAEAFCEKLRGGS